ncbi:hypothetical protein [Janthinobacterium psychrotolerans]|uniref:hypothetical protein n=1 Tax=Janthinobacterium psychrotolerans TaxID=1747903 RepID=UPI00080679B2|nr:hypothetical protein [Janthinobacterium psychrotolerans]
MTHKPPITSKSLPAQTLTKLHAATLSNMAHQQVVVVASADEAVLTRIAELLTTLSPSNLKLVEGIIRCVLVEQDNSAS